MIEKFIHKLQRVRNYWKRNRLFRFFFLMVIKGYRILERRDKKIIVKNIFNGILFNVPENSEYLISIDPANELLVDSYINIDSGVFIDIGSFIGKYALKIATNRKVKVIAIEPNPVSYNLLVGNAELNRVGDNFIPINCAVFKQSNLTVGLENNFSMSKLITDEKNNRRITVKTISVKDIFENYINDYNQTFLIKIDTEGFEVEIIKDLIPYFKLISDIKIVCEILPLSENKLFILETLQSNGFSAEQIDHSNYFFIKSYL